MPELPEVESIRRYLASNEVEGRRIERVEVGWPDSIVAPAEDAEAFATMISRKRIGSCNRRGKYLFAPLSDDRNTQSHIVLHMGMTGSLHIRNHNDDPVRYRRAVFHLDDDRRIELNDPRRWARMWAVENPSTAFPRLGPEPWDITPEQFAKTLRLRRSRIKPTLLDQNILAGVGNIYADEALHRTGISPLRRANRISTKRLMRLHAKIIAVLKHAIDFISTHPSQDGSPYIVDAHDNRMKIPRNPTSQCPNCNQPIKSQKIATRTAYHCPNCQH